MADIVYFWRIKQDGMVVCGGSSPDFSRREHERWRYGMQYAQEGPIVHEVRETGTRWRRPR